MKVRFTQLLPYLLCTLVAIPGLRTGFVLDDWVHRGLISGAFTHASPWNLFSFAPGDPERFWRLVENGPFPWFSLPELKIAFFRPLSSALVQLDVALFGDAPFPAHLHSLAWGLLLVAAAQRLYRKTIPGLAVVAIVLFAIDRSHALPMAWLANRNSVVATALAAWGLVGHLSWREGGRRSGLVLAVLAWTAALCSAEAAIGALAYVPAYELFGRDGDWKTRARALMPAGLVGLAFVITYRLAGAGAWGGATYIDPIREPTVYLANAPARLLAIAGAWSSGIPADLWLTRPEARPVLIGLGAVALIGWPLLWRWLNLEGEPEARAVRWLALGAALGVLPFLAIFPADRLLISSSLGLAPLAALVLRAAWRARRWLVLGWLSVALSLATSIGWFVTPGVMIGWRDAVTRAALQPKGLDTLSGKRLVIIDCSDFAVGMYSSIAMAAMRRPLPAAWMLLSPAMAAHRVYRLDERRFEVEIVDGRILDTVFEQNVRADRFPLRVGDVVKLKTLTVTVRATDRDKPTRFEVALDEPPSSYTFIRWNGDVFEPVTLPEPGQVLELPKTSDVAQRLLGG
ncbi:MAG: hypothetical protein AB1730_02535 [Myxococcota bacterium]|jgi:hypothetical protein